jgi:perosamine synthetase
MPSRSLDTSDSNLSLPSPPVTVSRIPLCEPHLDGREWEYVRDCLDSGWVSSVGQYVSRFERDVAARMDAKYAVATVNGTSALHIALQVSGVEPGDEVMVSTVTFIAPANAIRYVGAWPVFIDAEPRYWQMDVNKVADFLNRDCAWIAGAFRNRHTGRRVSAILPVHVLGHPVDMTPLMAIADDYGLAVIEDATESLGASYQGRPVGRHGHAACLSFNGNKIITSGGGGMFVTDDEAWAQRAAYLTTQAKDAGAEYVHQEIGYNYRLTNIQAALGVAQLERLDERVEVKRRIAGDYAARLAGVPGVECMREAPWARSAFWMYTMLVDQQLFGMSSRALMTILRDASIETRPLWQPLHCSPAHRGSYAVDCSTADRLYRDGISLPCSVGLTSEDQSRVISCIHHVREDREAAVLAPRRTS